MGLSSRLGLDGNRRARHGRRAATPPGWPPFAVLLPFQRPVRPSAPGQDYLPLAASLSLEPAETFTL